MTTTINTKNLSNTNSSTKPSDEQLATVFNKMVARLSKLSVEKHFDAYADIDWDAPEMQLFEGDPRMHLQPHDPVGDTPWYMALTVAEKSLVSTYRFASAMKIGWQFENALQRGLLFMAKDEPNGSTAFRYLHHEIIEESHHSMMFQELVNRTGLPVEGMSRFWRAFGPFCVLTAARLDPSFMFVFVLGGEEPVDYLQRVMLRDGLDHPLVERIMRIHVTEEARHISFARHYLTREVPKMGRIRRFVLSITMPLVQAQMSHLMVKPGNDMRKHCNIPNRVVKDAYSTPKGKALIRESVSKIQRMATELGLMNPVAKMVWKVCDIWTEPQSSQSAKSAISEPCA